ncbi:hypothetical protein A4R26_24825 [Niastella populi]|uniref:Uncharacterized protein n=1 Tax=Niastella populi TaxID=550983 RepID=A0A1V9FGG5_9BACT|nr:hypothetical protein A4R26_24825 [Niastella populi]
MGKNRGEGAFVKDDFCTGGENWQADKVAGFMLWLPGAGCGQNTGAGFRVPVTRECKYRYRG